MMNKKLTLTAIILTITLTSLYGDNTALRIIAPEAVARGSRVTIKIEVIHNGNNIFHHTNWVNIKINGKEHTKWRFKTFSLPEDENFTREITIIVNEKTVVEANGNCRIHGSTGAKKRIIRVK